MREANPPVAWMDVLDHIDRSLAQSLARTPEPAQVAATNEPARNYLAPLDERLAVWQSSLEQVERLAATSTLRLDAEHAALGEWLEKLAQVRDSCTRWVDANPLP